MATKKTTQTPKAPKIEKTKESKTQKIVLNEKEVPAFITKVGKENILFTYGSRNKVTVVYSA